MHILVLESLLPTKVDRNSCLVPVIVVLASLGDFSEVYWTPNLILLLATTTIAKNAPLDLAATI